MIAGSSAARAGAAAQPGAGEPPPPAPGAAAGTDDDNNSAASAQRRTAQRRAAQRGTAQCSAAQRGGASSKPPRSPGCQRGRQRGQHVCQTAHLAPGPAFGGHKHHLRFRVAGGGAVAARRRVHGLARWVLLGGCYIPAAAHLEALGPRRRQRLAGGRHGGGSGAAGWAAGQAPRRRGAAGRGGGQRRRRPAQQLDSSGALLPGLPAAGALLPLSSWCRLAALQLLKCCSAARCLASRLSGHRDSSARGDGVK